ncbi:hypothetical protein F4775DRAFT_595133 [Biscogniauxia sp. FL1348]|nr:hypothetical protein F4775DRAFT_595133 [Biscogniauxia sp. FL1348]
MSYFEKEEARRQAEQRYLIKDHRDGDFPGYIQAIKRCLEDHGFKKPVQLLKDPGQQDNLTTWIEYLGYEYFWYDRILGELEPLQPHYDEQWKKLVDYKVVSPYETRETSELLRIKKRIEDELLAAKLDRNLLDQWLDELSPQDYHDRLYEAEFRILHAREAKRLYVAREYRIKEFDTETREYQEIKDELERCGYLVRWIQEQIAQIEEESKEKEASEYESIKGKGKAVRFALNDESEAGPSRVNAKRKRGGTDDSDDSDGQQQTTTSSKRIKSQQQERPSGIDASTQASARNPSIPQGHKVCSSVRSREGEQASETDVPRSQGTEGNRNDTGQNVTRQARIHPPKNGSSSETSMSGVKLRRSKRIASLPKPKYA